MEPSNQELNNSPPQSVPHIVDVAVLGKAKKTRSINLIYQIAESPDIYKLDNAFDILFEETLGQIGDLTTNDN